MGDITTTRVQLNTTTGTQDIAVSGFGTPDAALIILQHVSGDNSITNDARLSIGATDGTSNVVNYIQSVDGVSTSSTDRRTAGGILGIVYNDAGSILQQCVFDSWVTDGIRIDNTAALGSTIFATVILFKNVQSGAFIEQMLTTSETVNVGFEPDLVFMMDTGNASTAYAGQAINVFGIAHNDGLDSNYGQFYFDRDSLATSQSGSYISDTYSFGQYFNDSLSWGGGVENYTATGFDLNANASAGNDYVVGLAIKFDNATNINLGVVGSPASTGAVSYDSAGFEPDFGLVLTTKNTLVDTVQSAGVQGLGIWSISDNSYQSNAYWSADGSATSDAVSLVSDNRLRDLLTSSSTLNEGTFVGFDTDGFDYNFTTVSATQRKWVELAIGAVGGGGLTISPTGIPTAEAFGTPSIVLGAVTISPTSIPSEEAVGEPIVTSGATVLLPVSIPSEEAVGTPEVITGLVSIEPVSIPSEEAVGEPIVTSGITVIAPTGIPSGEAFGEAVVANLLKIIEPLGIESEELFGIPIVLGGDRIIIPITDRTTWNTVAGYLRTLKFKGADNDVIADWLRSEGYPVQYNDAWNDYLELTEAYTGSLSDKYAKWKRGE